MGRRGQRAQRMRDEAAGVDTRTGEVPDGYGCPPELRHPCIAWDWLERDEVASVEAHGCNATAVITAWRRWQAARQAYAASVGMTVNEACGPGGRPTLGEHSHRL